LKPPDSKETTEVKQNPELKLALPKQVPQQVPTAAEDKKLSPLSREKQKSKRQFVFVEENGRNLVLAGTTETLVNNLTGTEPAEPQLLREFLFTYTYFTTSKELYQILKKRFKAKPQALMSSNDTSGFGPQQVKQTIQLRITQFVKVWMREFSWYFREDEDLVKRVSEFIDKNLTKVSQAWATSLKKLMDKKIKSKLKSPKGDDPRKELQKHKTSTAIQKAQGIAFNQILNPLKRVTRHAKRRDISFLNLHPKEISRQMALLEHLLFKKIKPNEILHTSWKKTNKAEVAPNVTNLIEWFNRMTNWVSREIVVTPNLKQRVAVVKRFIQIAKYCKDINNFMGMTEIVSAINSPCVSRLKQTFESLGKKDKETYKEMEELVLNPVHNFSKYRDIINSLSISVFPVVPYLGVMLSDLISIAELPNKDKEGLINFKKMRRITSNVELIIRLQQYAYEFEEVPEITDFLKTTKMYPEKDLFNYSKLCEPPIMVDQ